MVLTLRLDEEMMAKLDKIKAEFGEKTYTKTINRLIREYMIMGDINFLSKSGKGMTFGSALHYLKFGHKVTRTEWDGKGMWLEAQFPDSNSNMTLPYIYMKTACDNQVPWLASQADMFADDWEIVV